jgi:GxxExxY protein
MNKDEEKREEQTHAIIAAAVMVHDELGSGYLKQVYEEALEHEFVNRKVSYERGPMLRIRYRGIQLNTQYRADFVCYGGVIVELKTMLGLTGLEDAQMINYLKASGLRRGLLLNFGASELQYKLLMHELHEAATPA